jgi:hypothetical protein
VHGVTTSTSLEHPDVQCISNGVTHKSRKWLHASGVGPETTLGVYNSCLSTAHRAFMERYFYVATPEGFQPALEVKPGLYGQDEGLKDFWKKVVDEVGFSPVASLQSVVDSYSGAKRQLYQRAMVQFFAYNIDPQAAVLKSFVKFEKQNLGKAPRAINPRSPLYNLLLGAHIKFAEKRYYAAINKAYGEHTTATVIKGLDVRQTGDVLREKWDRFEDPVAIGMDAQKFDMHVSAEALVYEHSFYIATHTVDRLRTFDKVYGGYRKFVNACKPLMRRCGRRSRRISPIPTAPLEDLSGGTRRFLPWMLVQQIYNEGSAYFTDGKMKFYMEGTRSSGDMNTSLGNCLLMCGLVYAWARRSGVSIELCNNGDDCVAIMERADLEKFTDGLEEFFIEKGFRMEVEKPVFIFEEIEFCQSHPIHVNGQWTMVRNLETSLVKSSMCLVPGTNNKMYRKWLGAVGQCEGVLGVGVPVMQSFSAAYRRLGLRASAAHVAHVFKGSTRALTRGKCEVVSISDETRVSFYRGFGVTPDAQVFLEKHFNEYELNMDRIYVGESDAVDKPKFYVPPVLTLVRAS